MWKSLSHPTLCDPMDYSPPGSSVHGTLQSRVLEWVAILFSRGSSWPRDWTLVSCVAGRFFTVWATREAYTSNNVSLTRNIWRHLNSPTSQVLCGIRRSRPYWGGSGRLETLQCTGCPEQNLFPPLDSILASTLQVSIHLILTAVLWDSYDYYHYFTSEESRGSEKFIILPVITLGIRNGSGTQKVRLSDFRTRLFSIP